jgi:hypothetical protein
MSNTKDENEPVDAEVVTLSRLGSVAEDRWLAGGRTTALDGFSGRDNGGQWLRWTGANGVQSNGSRLAGRRGENRNDHRSSRGPGQSQFFHYRRGQERPSEG